MSLARARTRSGPSSAGPAASANQGTNIVTLNTTVTNAGIFNGDLNPGPCTVTISGTGSIYLVTGLAAFDNFNWFKKFGDPDFVYEQQMARIFGLEAIRMAGADVLPYDYEQYGKEIAAYIDTARKNLLPNKDRLHFIKDGSEVLPGVHAILAPSHTVGHTIFMINSGKETLCYVGDLAHHPVLLLEKPLTEFAYDTDPKMSAKSRVKMLTMLADNKTRMLAGRGDAPLAACAYSDEWQI